eukprot:38330-Pleurochrysis_carterae.AAC.1
MAYINRFGSETIRCRRPAPIVLSILRACQEHLRLLTRHFFPLHDYFIVWSFATTQVEIEYALLFMCLSTTRLAGLSRPEKLRFCRWVKGTQPQRAVLELLKRRAALSSSTVADATSNGATLKRRTSSNALQQSRPSGI